jgi:hypothetical protein
MLECGQKKIEAKEERSHDQQQGHGSKERVRFVGFEQKVV